jgi:hypothetical protein
MDPHKTESEFALKKAMLPNQSNLMHAPFISIIHISKLMTYYNTTIKNFDIDIKYIRIRIFD